LHGGGSTIESNWGRFIPALESSRRMLAVELQGHGRTGSGDQAASLEGSADGVAALLQELSVSGDPAHAERMFHLDRELMLTGFADWPDSLVASITAPTLVVAADRDVIRTEHAVLLASRIPNARLLIVPGNHGDYLCELVAAAGDSGPLRRVLPFMVNFLDQPEITTES
jgi:pimeloyl-ACP methyl ester carboxylesterase